MHECRSWWLLPVPTDGEPRDLLYDLRIARLDGSETTIGLDAERDRHVEVYAVGNTGKTLQTIARWNTNE